METPHTLNNRPRFAIWVLVLFIMLPPTIGMATGINKEIQTSDEIANELNYLLTFVGLGHADFRSLKTDKIVEVMKFVTAKKENGVLYFPDDMDGITSTYYEVDVARSFGQILQLTDNPEIPSVFTAPSSIRMSRWKAIDTPNHQRPKLWEQLPKLNGSVSFSGIENVVNTPDETTGTYYQYDLYRSVILTQFNGRNLLISLSKQVGISNVGRKGLIIGGDDQWNYYYSNEAGLNRAGFGWVDSYMYDSKSVAFYLEDAPAGNTVRVGVFKWLRAGWSGINFVKRSHIYDGLDRFTSVFKVIVEHPSILDTATWIDTLLEIQRLPKDQLQPIVRNYFQNVQNQAQRDGTLSSDELKVMSIDGQYMDSMGRDEMQSILTVEFLKQLLGKHSQIKLK